MARFNIKNGNSINALGAIVRGMGARIAAFGLDNDGQDDRHAEAQERFAAELEDDVVFADSLGAAREQRAKAMDAAGNLSKGGVYVQFHFDQTVEEKGQAPYRIVNVVVNDMSNKLATDKDGAARLGDDGDPVTDLNGIAEESLGFIVFARCG